MKTFQIVLATAAMFAAANAACPNACSGHGVCSTQYDMCSCNHGYMGADCSQRICPSGLAWVDVPNGDLNNDNDLNDGGERTDLAAPLGVTSGSSLNQQVRPSGTWERNPTQLYGDVSQADTVGLDYYVRQDEGHFLSECSNAGSCDRTSGQCACFAGFEGEACERSACPSGCSGHGLCRTMAEQLPAGTDYQLWDADKIQGCKCDGGWGGVACDMRVCERGDDPLTSKTSEEGINYGLDEAAEEQDITVRCSYGGTMVYPDVKLRFTDPVTGDQYDTGYFDLTDSSTSNTDAMLAALKGLPNQVLADYEVDGTVVDERVKSVTIIEQETNQRYVIRVVFDESYGNVPLMTAVTSDKFLCKGGAKVNSLDGYQPSYENVLVSPIGDGPLEYLKFDINATHPTNFTYRVTDIDGNVLSNYRDERHGVDVSALETLYNVHRFSTEAAKLQFAWAGADADRNAYDRWIIEYIVDPVITTSNRVYKFRDFPWNEQANTTYATYPNGTKNEILNRMAFGASGSAADLATYDPTYRLDVIDFANGIGGWYVNNEFVAWIDIVSNPLVATTPAYVPSANIIVDGSSYIDTTLASANTGNLATPTQADAYLPLLGMITTDGLQDGTSYHIFLNKDPIYTANTGPEEIKVRFLDNEAVTQPFVLLLKITKTSTSWDRYAWRLAEDPSWQDNGGDGYPIPDPDLSLGNATGLDNIEDYVNVQYPGDSRRAEVARLALLWNNDVDYDARMCADKQDATTWYYISIGSDGLNDRPVCSDRGTCDGSSGLCQCFAGYTGKACDKQSALAGASGTALGV